MNRIPVVLSSSVIAGILLAACPQSAPAASPAPAVTLKVSSYLPPKHHLSRNVMIPWIDEVGKRSGGRIKAEYYPSGQLGQAKDHYDMAVNGMADVAFFGLAYTPGRFPLTSITELPFSFASSTQASDATWKLFPKRLSGEFSDVHVLFLANASPNQLFTSKKAVSKLEDLKRLKVRSTGGYVSNALEALGLTPVTITSADIYTSVDRGVIEGYVIPYASVPGIKLQEVTKYGVEIGLGTSLLGVAMNKAAYEKLSPDLKKIVDEVSEFARRKVGASYDSEDKTAKDLLIQKGINIVTLSAAEMKQVRDKAIVSTDSWVKDMQAKGLPGRATMDDFIKITEGK